MNIAWIAIGVIVLLLAVAAWCEVDESVKKRLFSFFFEQDEEATVVCPSCKTEGTPPLQCGCEEREREKTRAYADRLREKYFD